MGSATAVVVGPEGFVIAHVGWLVTLACVGCVGLGLLVRGLTAWAPFAIVVLLACADQILGSNEGDIDPSIFVFFPGMPMLAAAALGVGFRRVLARLCRPSSHLPGGDT